MVVSGFFRGRVDQLVHQSSQQAEVQSKTEIDRQQHQDNHQPVLRQSQEPEQTCNARQDGGSDMMIFKIPFLISHISKFTWLDPGDMIATGSPGGSAIENDPPNWLKPGEEISINIEPVGTLTNPIAAE